MKSIKSHFNGGLRRQWPTPILFSACGAGRMISRICHCLIYDRTVYSRSVIFGVRITSHSVISKRFASWGVTRVNRMPAFTTCFCWVQRAFELPPREVPFALVAVQSERVDYVPEGRLSPEQQADWLRSGGWSIAQVFVDGDALWLAGQHASLLVRGDEPSDVPADVAMRRRRPMWQPSALVAQALPPIEVHLGALGTLLDLGCGSGRDTVWCAQRGWHVTAVDNRRDALARLKGLLERSALGDRVRVMDCDVLRDDGAAFVSGHLPTPHDVLLLIRFFRRSFLPRLPGLVRPGGYVVMGQFLEGAEAFGHPSDPEDIVRVGELAAMFAPPDWQLVQDDRLILPDGRPFTHFVARRSME